MCKVTISLDLILYLFKFLSFFKKFSLRLLTTKGYQIIHDVYDLRILSSFSSFYIQELD